MNIQRLLLLLIASIGACGASDGVLRGDRFSKANATTSDGGNATSSNTTAPHVDNDDYADDDDASAVMPVGDFGASSDDDAAAAAAAALGDDDDFASLIDDSDNPTLFKPPDEREPRYWKEFVSGFFLFCAGILCVLTARKACCKSNDYQEIPTASLVV